LHNCSGSKAGISFEIAGKRWNGWHDDYNFILLTCCGRPKYAFNKGSPNLVSYRLLGVTSGGDEELILNVQKVSTVSYHAYVRIRNRVLDFDPMAPG
jgi:hypothetical protein